MFLLRNKSYLIISSWYWRQMKEHFIILTSLTFQHFCLYWSQFSIAQDMRCQWLLLCILIFQSDFQQYLVCFLNFFQHQNGKKVSSTRKRNYCDFSKCAFAKLKISHSAEKFLKRTPPFTNVLRFNRCIVTTFPILHHITQHGLFSWRSRY